MKIIELILGDNVFSGIEAISLVESPAIEEDFIALKSQEIKLAEKKNRDMDGRVFWKSLKFYPSKKK